MGSHRAFCQNELKVDVDYLKGRGYTSLGADFFFVKMQINGEPEILI